MHGGQARAQIIAPAFANPNYQLDLPTSVEFLDGIRAGDACGRHKRRSGKSCFEAHGV
jgi:hypothetical protein